MQYVFLIRSRAGCKKYVTRLHLVFTANARAYQKHVLHGQETVSIFVQSGKSESEITSNRRLRSTYCTIEANYWRTRSIARPLCDRGATCVICLRLTKCWRFVSLFLDHHILRQNVCSKETIDSVKLSTAFYGLNNTQTFVFRRWFVYLHRTL